VIPPKYKADFDTLARPPTAVRLQAKEYLFLARRSGAA
jgi:hypothetical protein